MNDRDHFNLDRWCEKLYHHINSKEVTEVQLNLAKLELEKMGMDIEIKILRKQIKS